MSRFPPPAFRNEIDNAHILNNKTQSKLELDDKKCLEDLEKLRAETYVSS